MFPGVKSRHTVTHVGIEWLAQKKAVTNGVTRRNRRRHKGWKLRIKMWGKCSVVQFSVFRTERPIRGSGGFRSVVGHAIIWTGSSFNARAQRRQASKVCY